MFFFNQFTSRLAKYYPELYRSGTTNKPEVAEFGAKWGWYQFVYGIAKENIFNFDKVSELNIHKAMLFASFEADKNRLESKMIKNK